MGNFEGESSEHNLLVGMGSMTDKATLATATLEAIKSSVEALHRVRLLDQPLLVAVPEPGTASRLE